jgi:2-polyprenyl-3-methyl-5-hydroxy-6-metoxy-1,4-benzoquinol methylase
MDQPGLDGTVHNLALRGLGRINRVSFSASIVWPAILSLERMRANQTIRVLDLATGGGDVPIDLAKRARRAGLDLRIEGCDVSPAAVSFATRAAAEVGVSIRFFPLDALCEPIPEGFDIITCSLFLHHLDEEDAVRLLRKMAGATRSTIVVNDLLRSHIGYGIAWAGCRLLSRSQIVHHDGPTSVRAAFSLDEARELADRAGLEGLRLERRWPWRFLLSWSRRHS